MAASRIESPPPLSRQATLGESISDIALPSFQYTDIADGEIRLLYLESGTDGDPLKGTIKVVSLDAGVGFQAISYCWGDEAVLNNAIEIDNAKLPVTSNLHNALLKFRHPDHGQVLWADAVCINQDKVVEKEQQVHRMAEIYKRAAKVLIWVGNGMPGLTAAFKVVNTMVAEYRESILDQMQEGDDNMFGICAHLQLAYFKRDTAPKSVTQQLDNELIHMFSLAELLHRPWFGRAWV